MSYHDIVAFDVAAVVDGVAAAADVVGQSHTEGEPLGNQLAGTGRIPALDPDPDRVPPRFRQTRCWSDAGEALRIFAKNTGVNKIISDWD